MRFGFLLGALASAFLPAVGWSQWIKLNNVGMPFSDVIGFQISPSGDRVVYCHDPESDNFFEFWSVSLTGGTPVRLSNAHISVAEFDTFFCPLDITPDGARVIIHGEENGNDVFEVFSAPIDGSAPAVRLNAALVTLGSVFNPQLTAAGDRVVYLADQEVDDRFELFSVPVDGSAAPVKLNGPLVAGGDLSFGFSISADGSRVVYRADERTDEVIELFSVPMLGGTANKLNGGLVSGGEVVTAAISPNGGRVVYLADQEADERFELYSVPTTGGTVTKLNGLLDTGGDVRDFLISPDSSRVVYRGDQEVNDKFELFSVAIGGGVPVKINGAILVAGGDVETDFSLTPDGTRVLYRADQQSDEVFDLYSVPIEGGTAVKLSSTIIPAGDVFGFKLSPDGSRVVYDHDNDSDRRLGRQTAPDGPAQSGALVWGTQLTRHFGDYLIGPTSQYVILRAERIGDGVAVGRLWRAPLIDGPNLIVDELIPAADFVAGGNVAQGVDDRDGLGTVKIGPKGSIVYIADQDTDDVFDLYAIPGVIFSDGFE